MNKKLPEVQSAWKKWQELYENNLEALVWWQYLVSLNDIILFIVPYIISGCWHSSMIRPAKRKLRKVNRNV